MLGAGEGRGVRQAQHPTVDLLPARFRVPPTERSGADQVAVHAAFSVTELSVLIARRTAASGWTVERHVSQGADSEEGDLCRQEVWERLRARIERGEVGRFSAELPTHTFTREPRGESGRELYGRKVLSVETESRCAGSLSSSSARFPPR